MAMQDGVVVDNSNLNNMHQIQVEKKTTTPTTVKKMAAYGVPPFPFVTLVHVLGIVAGVLVLIWSISYRGGLAWSSSNKNLIFNLHPVLMSIGFIFVSSEAILIFKSIPGTKQFRKGFHLTLQAIALILAVIGVIAAFKYHNEMKIDNLYSLHSWLGLTTVVLFFIQWTIGFVTFWYPGGTGNTRAAVLPWHVFLGMFIYVMTIASAETGILEKVTFLQSSKVFGHYDREAMLANCFGLVLLLLGAFTILAAVIPQANREDDYRAIVE